MRVVPLTEDLLDACAWAGSETHRGYVRQALARVPLGEVDFLAVLDNDGLPVSMGAVDYARHPGEPELWMLSTDEARRGQGFGTVLIAGLELAVAARGIQKVRLSVEDDNPGAYRLYGRLGYLDHGEVEQDSWQQQEEDGTVVTHHATCHVLRKALTRDPSEI